MEVIQWVEEGQTLDEFAEGTNVKVFGSIRLVMTSIPGPLISCNTPGPTRAGGT